MVIRLVRATLLGLVVDQPQQCVYGFFSTGSTESDHIFLVISMSPHHPIKMMGLDYHSVVPRSVFPGYPFLKEDKQLGTALLLKRRTFAVLALSV